VLLRACVVTVSISRTLRGAGGAAAACAPGAIRWRDRTCWRGRARTSNLRIQSANPFLSLRATTFLYVPEQAKDVRQKSVGLPQARSQVRVSGMASGIEVTR